MKIAPARSWWTACANWVRRCKPKCCPMAWIPWLNACARWRNRVCGLCVCTGGTGLGPRDVTPEALRLVADRSVHGLAEMIRSESAKHTPLAWLSRAEVDSATWRDVGVRPAGQPACRAAVHGHTGALAGACTGHDRWAAARA